MARKKTVIMNGVTRESADEAFAAYAKADARVQKINAEIELKCAQIRERFMGELSKLDEEREQAFAVLQSYAMENQEELFSKKKSLEMSHGVIGFRTGTPKLKTLKGFTWASALNLVKEFLPGYVRTSEEVAKDRLLADRDLDAVPVLHGDGDDVTMPMSSAMAKCGIQVVQDETFFVEPKKEEN